MQRHDLLVDLTDPPIQIDKLANGGLRSRGQMIGIGGQAAIKLFGLNVDAAAQGLGAKVNEQRHALHAVLLEQLFGQIDGAICNDLHDWLLERYAHCTSFCYNNYMQPTTELCSSEAGFIYPLRRAPPPPPLPITPHPL